MRLSFFHAHYSQARTGTEKYLFSLDHEEDWQPYPVDQYSAICDDHTYILFVQWTCAIQYISEAALQNDTLIGPTDRK